VEILKINDYWYIISDNKKVGKFVSYELAAAEINCCDDDLLMYGKM